MGKRPRKSSRNSWTWESTKEALRKDTWLSRRKRKGKVLDLDLLGREDVKRRADARQKKPT
jgi:hypothetical protein